MCKLDSPLPCPNLIADSLKKFLGTVALKIPPLQNKAGARLLVWMNRFHQITHAKTWRKQADLPYWEYSIT